MSAEDNSEIVRLINVSAFAVDSLHWDLFDAVFTPDVEADYGPPQIWRNLTVFKRDFDAIHRPFDTTQHTITNHQVVVSGDRASSLAYGFWRLTRHVPQGGGDVWTGGGWYDDSWVRTSEGWRINKRVCRVGWWEGNPRVGDTVPGGRFDPNVSSIRHETERGALNYIKALSHKE